MLNKDFGLLLIVILGSTTTIPTAHSAPSSEKAAQIDACIVSTCGSPSVNMSGSAAFERVSNTPSKEAVAQSHIFGDEIKALIKGQVEAEQKKALALQYAIADKAPLVLSKEVKVLFVSLRVMKALAPVLKEVAPFSYETRKYEVNHLKFDAYLSTLPSAARNAVRIILENVYLPVLDTLMNGALAGGTLKYRLAKLYPTLPLSKALRKDAAGLIEARAKFLAWLGKDLGETIELAFDEALFFKAANEGDLSQSEITTYERTFPSIAIFSQIMKAKYAAAFSDFPMDIEADVEKLRNTDFVSNYETQAQKLDTQALSVMMMSQCSFYLKISLDANTSALRIRKFQPVIAEVKNAAKSVVQKFADPATLQSLHSAIDKLEFSYPTSSAERIDSVRAVMRSEQGKLQKKWAAIKENNRNAQLLDALSTFMDSEAETLEQQIYSKSNLLKACEELPTYPITDAANTFAGKVFVGWYSLAFPQRGASILGHEIGHALSRKLRDQQLAKPSTNRTFTESLTCVANRNPFVLNPSTIQGRDDTTWSEEDWADHFSALVMNELSAKGSALGTAPNLACSLINDSKGSYVGNQLEPVGKRTHSEPLLRLLMYAQDRNQLTSECRVLLNEKAPTRKMQCH